MRKLFVPLLVIFFILSITTDYYRFISIAVSVTILLYLLLKFGKGIALLELMGLYSCVIYLIFPLLGYAVYTNQNQMAVLWRRHMPIKSDMYFGFVLPAIIAYLIGLFIFNLKERTDEGNNMVRIVKNIKSALFTNKKAGWILLLTGMFFFMLKKFLPPSLSFIGNTCHLFIFPGLLYIHFQPKFKGKILVYTLVPMIVLLDAINTGMFTLFFYMGITIASFLVINRRIKFSYKLLVLAGAIFCTITLHLVKSSLRKQTWSRGFSGSRIEIFQSAVVDKASNIRTIFSYDAFFPIYHRLNQGYNTALVMRRIPKLQDYDNGKSIFTSVAAAFVPRFLWRDKPQAGGVYNMWHFAGFKLKGWSTNIGPVGEAYGNFGIAGGIIYMFLFGLFISWAYLTIFKICKKHPLLLLWIPLIFFETMYSMENDTLQVLNSLVKAAIFLWILNKVFPYLFNAPKKIYEVIRENSSKFLKNGPGLNGPGLNVP